LARALKAGATLGLAGAMSLTWLASRANADAAIEPSAVDYGQQPRGVQSATALVELVNTGANAFRVYRTEVNSGPDNADFVVAIDGCSGLTVEPGGRCPLEIAFRPTGLGPTSQTIGIDVSGPDYRTFGERAAVVTLTGTGIEEGAAPLPQQVPAPGSRQSSGGVPIGLVIPIVGVGAIGLGFVALAATAGAPRGRRA
jgi:hypothetical protein